MYKTRDIFVQPNVARDVVCTWCRNDAKLVKNSDENVTSAPWEREGTIKGYV